MAIGRELYLIYHEILTSSSRYSYSLSAAQFDEHLRVAAELNSKQQPGTKEIRFTFDDGHCTHFEQALPLLESRGIKAIFFVTVGWIGNRAGFMSWPQVQELARLGHEVQAHGWSHRFLTACSQEELQQELQQARIELEQRLGTAVDAMSMPGGRWNMRVVRECGRSGFARLFTSDPLNLRQSFPLRLIGRINVGGSFEPTTLESLRNPRSLLAVRYSANHLAKEVAQHVMGDQLYHTIWRWWTSHEQPEP